VHFARDFPRGRRPVGMTSKITIPSTRCPPRLRPFLLPAICLAIASSACIDPPGGEAETQSALSAPTTAPPEILSRRIASGPLVDATLAAARTAGSQPPVTTQDTGGSVVTAPPGCYGPFAILAGGSGLWVSAELDYGGGGYGMLRARASQVSAWELFILCTDGFDWTINAGGNGLWVSTELDYGGTGYAMLRARGTSPGPWEHYTLFNNNSDGTYAIDGPNNLLVAAEFGYSAGENGMLRSRTGGLTVGPWERFLLR
jgi:hypothetical protein